MFPEVRLYEDLPVSLTECNALDPWALALKLCEHLHVERRVSGQRPGAFGFEEIGSEDARLAAA